MGSDKIETNTSGNSENESRILGGSGGVLQSVRIDTDNLSNLSGNRDLTIARGRQLGFTIEDSPPKLEESSRSLFRKMKTVKEKKPKMLNNMEARSGSLVSSGLHTDSIETD
jgi:hypothetical protein